MTTLTEDEIFDLYNNPDNKDCAVYFHPSGFLLYQHNGIWSYFGKGGKQQVLIPGEKEK